MRFVVYGSGAVGGVIGARLFQHGHDVALVARGRHYEAIADHGLRIRSPDDDETLRVPVIDRPQRIEFGEGDIVLLTMKSQDTAAALRDLAVVAPPATPVVCVQNGVDNERMALRLFSHVYGVCVMLPATHLEPGVVEASSAPVTGILDVGRYPSGADPVASDIAGAFEKSTFVSVPRPDIMRWKHTKLLMNLGNAAEAICGPSARSSPVVAQARREGVACLRAAGIDFVSKEEDASRRGDLLRYGPVGGQLRGGGSSWQSLARGTGSIEADYLNGEVVLLGRAHGIPTPVNELLRQLANRLTREGAPPGTIDEEELIRRLGDAGE